MCNCIVWDDARTAAVVRTYEQKLDDEGIEIDPEDESERSANGDAAIAEGSKTMGNGSEEQAFASRGDISSAGVVGTIGQVMEGLGLVGRGKAVTGKKRRKGLDSLVDM